LYGRYIFSFLRSLHTVFIYFLPEVYADSFFPAASPTIVGGVLDGSYSNRSEVESYRGFDLHLLYGWEW
jgi:hypothetical protein